MAQGYSNTGRVKWFNQTKGFGFVTPDKGSKDLFVHITALQAGGITRLNDNQRVSYDVSVERGHEVVVNLKVIC